MASKMWDDLASWNIEFAELFPVFSLTEINALEVLFLKQLNYNLFISGSDYARYYFALRGLRNTPEKRIPRHYLTLQIPQTKTDEDFSNIEARSFKLDSSNRERSPNPLLAAGPSDEKKEPLLKAQTTGFQPPPMHMNRLPENLSHSLPNVMPHEPHKKPTMPIRNAVQKLATR